MLLFSKRTALLLAVSALIVLAGCNGAVDQDGDGLNRSIEQKHGLDDTLIDTDGDGLKDSREFNNSSLNPTTNDTDSDGLLDAQELELGTDPANADTDNDGAKDGVEVDLGSNPLDQHSDSDGVTDGEEIRAGTSPVTTDTDDDGLSDDVELADSRLSPVNADTDGDGLSDSEERQLGTKPHRADTDGDGLEDGDEQRIGTSPLEGDSDGDGLSDGVEDPPGEDRFSDPTIADTDGDGLGDELEYKIGTDPTAGDTDGDGRSDLEEHQSDSLDPLSPEVQVIDGSPEAGLSNVSLQSDALHTIEFLSALPENKTKRDTMVTRSATEVCDAHNTVASNVSSASSEIGADTYRNTYRVSHAAKVMGDLGADVNPRVIEKRMQTAREASSVAAKYAPVIGSYQRLHDASCAVKSGEPGAKQDFYIASAAFTADLALAQQQVVYKAAFKTTGVVANKVGLMRLARVCGYKCVGLVESEMYWVASGTYSGAIDQVAVYAIEGNLTTDGMNATQRQEVTLYLENRTGSELVGGVLVPTEVVVDCVERTLSVDMLWKLTGDLSTEAINILRQVLTDGNLPRGADLSFVNNVDDTSQCVKAQVG